MSNKTILLNRSKIYNLKHIGPLLLILLLSVVLSTVFTSFYIQKEFSLDQSKKEDLANYLCKIVEPRLQIGAVRDAQDFLISSSKALDKNLVPLIEIKTPSENQMIGPETIESDVVYSCSFTGIKNIRVDFKFSKSLIDTNDILMVFSFSMFISILFIWIIGLLIKQSQIYLASLLEYIVYKELVGIEKPISQTEKWSSWFVSKLKINTKTIQTFKTQMNELKQTIDKQQEKLNEKSKLDALFQISRQVSHDIRSPLSALNMMLGQLDQISEQKRTIIRSAVNRINDISNQLLNQSKHQSIENSKMKTKIQFLSPIIESIVSEKRMQFREKQDFLIEFDLSKGYGIFAPIESSEFKRALSNLINNAIEALPDKKGHVVIELEVINNNATITINDNGKGIPQFLLEKLGQPGITYGKQATQSGSGLGVFHAKTTIESFGGVFQVESEEGSGTQITIKLPKAKPPSWFVEQLVVHPGMTLVSLDDDLTIHQIWSQRLESLGALLPSIQYRSFSSLISFKNWFQQQNIDKSKFLFLIDYEFSGQAQNGLEIIDEFNLTSLAILVTSKFEEDNILKQCENKKILLIPKPIVGFVPLVLNTNN